MTLVHPTLHSPRKRRNTDHLFPHYFYMLLLGRIRLPLISKAKGGGRPRYVGCIGKCRERVAQGFRRRPELCWDLASALDLEPGKTIKDQANWFFRKKANSRIDETTALPSYCQSYFTQTHLDVMNERFPAIFSQKYH